jgi:hypothetical protein
MTTPNSYFDPARSVDGVIQLGSRLREAATIRFPMTTSRRRTPASRASYGDSSAPPSPPASTIWSGRQRCPCGGSAIGGLI